MKVSVILILITLFIFNSAYAEDDIESNLNDEFLFGGGLIVGNMRGRQLKLGLDLRSIIKLNKSLSINTNFNYFILRDLERNYLNRNRFGSNSGYYTFDVNILYKFIRSKNLKIYSLTGASYGVDNWHNPRTLIGLNIGFGALININTFTLNPEIKHVFIGHEHIVTGISLLFPID